MHKVICAYCGRNNFLKGLVHQIFLDRNYGKLPGWKCGSCKNHIRFTEGTRKKHYFIVVFPLGIAFTGLVFIIKNRIDPVYFILLFAVVYIAASFWLLYSQGALEAVLLPPDWAKEPIREYDIGDCEHCHREFEYRLIHNGFNESSYAYCNACGLTAILDGWKVPETIHMALHQIITPEVESQLAPCQCGGSFSASASPRCPHCRQALSAERAADYIERQSEGAKKGWRWQRSWKDLYCIIIEDRVVRDIWRKQLNRIP